MDALQGFVGTWRLVESDKFDEYMKALDVGFATRKIGNVTKPDLVVCIDDDYITLQSLSAFKNTSIKFKLEEEFEETTVDGRNSKTTMTLNNGKLVQVQRWNGKETTVERELKDGKLIATCTMGDVVCTRTYEKKE
ncbi:fatty acid-binding protein, liver-like [Protopterus annectens]|uniref:fatty acid-binding protein, liver-like n=1 Tax=Protopterus annectens TaxID=7888 RepID=UPI001CF99E58|nr:fatty acid-binding protein, liver-like [Protopterus annectens]